ncbi:MAG TPA: nicotinamide riboside transporter PnuC [Cyclobacteriaceae bacterium]|jgi:nicotinamide mononucleotide transporter|nr:nicotinamide riboside transporter PnuC [Cyclobacteriaceae bacterium]
MSFHEWQDVLVNQLRGFDALQWGILIFGIAEVLLARANNPLLYPAGIISTVLAIYSLFTAQLYAECVLYLYYVVMSVYGWWHWVFEKTKTPVKVEFASKREWAISIIIIFAGWGVGYFALVTFTPSTVPLWDAWVSSTAWAGTWLLARRRVENWILLNVSNAFAIPLLFYKDLPLFAILTIFLLVIACIGYFDWTKMARKPLANER